MKYFGSCNAVECFVWNIKLLMYIRGFMTIQKKKYFSEKNLKSFSKVVHGKYNSK